MQAIKVSEDKVRLTNETNKLTSFIYFSKGYEPKLFPQAIW